MNAEFLHEPELEFGTGRHIDIRFGLMNYGPLDFQSTLAPKSIRLGIVGTPETIEGTAAWLESCRSGISAKPSKRPNLFPRFPGFGGESNLQAQFVVDSRLQRPIAQSRFDRLCKHRMSNQTIRELAALFVDELRDLAESSTPDVYICAFPFSLVEFLNGERDQVASDDDYDGGPETEHSISTYILHDYLKATAMQVRKPIQVIRPGTYDRLKRPPRSKPGVGLRELQDEATRAWNLYTALYYKAGGVPWRLVRNPTELATCFIGVSFYTSLDQRSMQTSMAQVFNERGEGVILRGAMAKRSETDKQIHLSAEDSFGLLSAALDAYRREHRNSPARVVIHKSSQHNGDEIDGFIQALRAFSIEPEQADLISVTRSFTRLYRRGRYPPLRGTLLHTGGETSILYTKGSVDFFTAYPGLYIPLPLAFRCDRAAQTPSFIAREILALTKMNWNNTQFDGGQPITLRAARQVGNILKYVATDFEPNYRFYM